MSLLNAEARRLARELASIRERLERLEGHNRQSQLAFSSIENGSIKANDALGQLRAQIGRQDDGTFAVTYTNGAQPPIPSLPLVTAGQLSLIVYWDGTFQNAAKPKDFQRVDIHVGTAPDFWVDPATTLYASLFGEGAFTVPLDTRTYYVRLVAVSNADVASNATTAVQGDPAAAHQIAAGSIGAEQLAAQIVLASRLIAGNPTAQRFEIDIDGIRGYDANNMQTIFQDPETGNLIFRGTLETATTGKRLVINDQGTDPNRTTLDFHGDDPAVEHASIFSYPGPTTSDVALRLQSSTGGGSGGVPNQGFMFLQNDIVRLGLREPTTNYDQSTIWLADNFTDHISSGHTVFVDEGQVESSIGHVARFIMVNPDGSHDTSSQINYMRGSLGTPMWSNPGHDVGFVFAGGAIIHCVGHGDVGGYRRFRAIVENQSSARVKRDFADIPFSPLHTVLSTPIRQWRYEESSGDDRVHYGPITEDLPEELVIPNEDGRPDCVNLMDMIGMCMSAIQELATNQGVILDRTRLPDSVRERPAPPERGEQP